MIEKNVIIFVHIPKTGGSTFWSNLVDSLPQHVSVDDIYHQIIMIDQKIDGGEHRPDDAQLKSACEAIANGYCSVPDGPGLFIHHHFQISVESFFPDASYIATFRDPSERFLSEVRHCRKDHISFYWRFDAREGVERILKRQPFLRSYYRRYLSGLLFHGSFRDVDELGRCRDVDLPADEEILGEFGKKFIDSIFINDGELPSRDVDELSHELHIGRMFCNSKRHGGTITDKTTVRANEIEYLSRNRKELFASDYELLAKIERWVLDKRCQERYIPEGLQALNRYLEISSRLGMDTGGQPNAENAPWGSNTIIASTDESESYPIEVPVAVVAFNAWPGRKRAGRGDADSLNVAYRSSINEIYSAAEQIATIEETMVKLQGELRTADHKLFEMLDALGQQYANSLPQARTRSGKEMIASKNEQIGQHDAANKRIISAARIVWEAIHAIHRPSSISNHHEDDLGPELRQEHPNAIGPTGNMHGVPGNSQTAIHVALRNFFSQIRKSLRRRDRHRSFTE